MMSSREFASWIAYYNIDPFGEGRADYRNALSIACSLNAQRTKNSRPFKVQDFMPDWSGGAHKKSDEEIAHALVTWAKMSHPKES